MAITVALYEKSWDNIRARAEALPLDLDIRTFDAEGFFRGGERRLPPEEVEADYMWLSTHLNADGVVSVAFDIAKRLRRLDVLQTFNAGLDHPAYKEIAARGTRICNSSAQGIAIAEYVFAQVFALLHPLEAQRAMQAERRWGKTPFREISGTEWLIIGYGPIGEAIAKRAKGFEAGVSVIRRLPEPAPFADRTGTVGHLPAYLGAADIVVLACPLTEATRGMAGAGFFEALKPGAMLLNIARGAVVDTPTLLSALDAGRVETAVLDVFEEEPLPEESPLWSHPKVRITPHTSFFGDGAAARWDQLFLDNISRFAAGAPLIREVRPEDI